MQSKKYNLSVIKRRYKTLWATGVVLLAVLFGTPYLLHGPERKRAAEFTDAFAKKILGGTMGEVINIVGRPDDTDKRHQTMMYFYEREFQRQPEKKKVRMMIVFTDGHAMRVTHSILQ